MKSLLSTELQICSTEGFFKTSAKLASLSWRSEVWTVQRPDPGAQGHVAEPDWLSGSLNISSSCWRSSCFSSIVFNLSVYVCHNLGLFPNQRRSWKDKFRPLMRLMWVWRMFYDELKRPYYTFLGFLYLSFVVLWSFFCAGKSSAKWKSSMSKRENTPSPPETAGSESNL